jgi:predicted MFS family arabinose efflux permease
VYRDWRGRLERALAGLRGGGRGWTLAAIAAGWFLVLGLRFVVPALLPAITRDFAVSDTAAGAAITLLWVTYAAMQFPAGALADRLGERLLLAASALGSAVSVVVFAVSPTFLLFLLATGAYGLTSGLYGPPRGIALSRIYPDNDGAAFGAVLATGSVGAALLPPVAAYATGWVGWRGALGLTVPGFLLAGVALWRVVPRGGARATRADGSGSDAAAVGESVGAAVRARAAEVRRAVASRQVALAVSGVTLMLFAFQGLTAFFTTYLVEAKGLTDATAGALFGLLFLSGAVFQSVGGALADRYGYSRVLAAVSMLGVVPLVALPYVEGLAGLVAIAAVIGTRLSIAPISNAYIVSTLPAEIQGTAWGAIRTGFFMIGAFGSTVVGAMVDRNLFTEAFFLLAGLTAVAGLVYLFLPEREPAGDPGQA